ncbi:MAG: immunoglobulin domain-containing family protein [Dermatophilaceae bacterium]
MSSAGAYSQVADEQLDSLEAGSDVDLYNAVLDACALIFRLPAQAQARSTAITAAEGIRFRLPVAGHPPYKVFWSSDGPRIEAVFPYP